MTLSIRVITALSFLLGNVHIGNAQECTTSKDGSYKLTSTSEIGPSMEGEKVVITSKIIPNDDMVVCTLMFCDDSNPCCNTCNTNLIADDGINLYPGGIEIGCSGTNCDWDQQCTYYEGDVAVIHGTVGDNGTAIYVDDSCLFGTSNGINDDCGMPRDGYTETNVDSLSGKNGESVMVTQSISINTDLAACTSMFCLDDNLCCNSCTSGAAFGNVSLTSDTYAIGCHGTNCDYEENCIYHDKEIVTVYGKVVATPDNAVTIEVDDHCPAKPRCTDVSDIDFGMCMMFMGYGVADGECVSIGGCGSNEHVFYNDMKECVTSCRSPSCDDHSGEFYGNCKMIVGYGVVDGVCSSIGGCNKTEGLFDSMGKCERSCGTDSFVGITTMIDPPATTSSCVDFTGEFFGNCRMILGYGLVDGACSTLGGCNRTDDMFATMGGCELACGNNTMKDANFGDLGSDNSTMKDIVGDLIGSDDMTSTGYAASYGYPMTAYLSVSLAFLSFIFV